MLLKLSQIQATPATQSRYQINTLQVDEYIEALKNDDQFPPLEVFYDDSQDEYYLVDGFHRFEAYQKIGILECEVMIHDGDLRDAILYAVGVNDKHGLPRTHADKRKAALTLLEDKEWGQWSDREIARRCRVSNKFVTNLRSELLPVHSSNPNRTYTQKRKGKKYTYTMDTTNIGKKPVKDKIADLPDEKKEAVKEKLESGEADTPKEALKQVEKEEREQEREIQIKESSTRNDPSPVNLINGDMLTVDLIQQFNCIVADPPYNVTPWEWDQLGDRQKFVDLTARWLKRCQSLLMPDYTLFWFCSPSYMADIEFVMRDLRLPIQSRLIWHRRNMAKGSDAKFKYLDSWECIFHISNRPINFDTKWNDERFDLQTFAVPQTNFIDKKLHPTQKPLELIRWLIRTGTFPGDHILDPFAGSGTTGHACILENRECTLIEKEESYVQAIQYRLSKEL